MRSRTLVRRLERIETKLNPPDKPGITVIVDGAGEEMIFHLPDRRRPPHSRQEILKEKLVDD